MTNKAIWWSQGVFYDRKMDVPATDSEPLRMEVPGYMNPKQTCTFLNKDVKEHFVLIHKPSQSDLKFDE